MSWRPAYAPGQARDADGRSATLRAGPAGPGGPIRAFSRRRDGCPAFCVEDSRYAETFRDADTPDPLAEAGSTAVFAVTWRLLGMVRRDGRLALIQPGEPAG
jgi:hypothetical protein